jgi:hypothetical protein
MLEIVGLIIGTVFLFILSAVAGLMYAVLAWALLRRQGALKKIFIVVAAGIPPASATWILVCAVIFTFFVPGATDRLFGDFKEPLPNDYVLTGLSKMPDFAFIDSPLYPQPQLLGGIARIDVDGPLVLGEYSHRSDSFTETVPGHIKYFIFDTHSRQVQNLQSLGSTDPYSGRPLHLVEPQLFRSHEPAQILRRRIENLIYCGPPILFSISFFVFVLRIRRSQDPIPLSIAN